MEVEQKLALPENNASPTHYQTITWGGTKVKRSFISDLIIAENSLRELIQRETLLNSKLVTFQKTAMIESDSDQLDEVTKELSEIQREYYRKERCLYRAIDEIPLHRMLYSYRQLRQNDMWFMRASLVQDCSDQGGCCSRQCGCCARRDVSRSNRSQGRGHYTFECLCCINNRDFEFSDEEKEDIRQDLARRLENLESTACLARHTDSFFMELTTGDIARVNEALGGGAQKSWKRRILR
ncbi:hypothetical protein N7540_002024 [Penicillium herquei]|nr:hypothetical protein N7540_002024 [Penicillium herquei]